LSSIRPEPCTGSGRVSCAHTDHQNHLYLSKVKFTHPFDTNTYGDAKGQALPVRHTPELPAALDNRIVLGSRTAEMMITGAILVLMVLKPI
jgi:hypothetical protein